MRSSKAERRRRRAAGLWDGRLSPDRPQKMTNDIEVWKKQIVRHFSGHAWQEYSIGKLRCSDCGLLVWFRLADAPANIFQVVVSDRHCGWTDRPILGCDEMAVENVQEA